MQTAQSDYFSAYRQLKLTRDAKGVLGSLVKEIKALDEGH